MSPEVWSHPWFVQTELAQAQLSASPLQGFAAQCPGLPGLVVYTTQTASAPHEALPWQVKQGWPQVTVPETCHVWPSHVALIPQQ